MIVRLLGLLIILGILSGCKSEPFPDFEVENYEEHLKLFIQGDFGLVIYVSDNQNKELVLQTNNQEPMRYWFIINEEEVNIESNLNEIQIVNSDGCSKILDGYTFTIDQAKKIEEKRFNKGAAINKPIILEEGKYPIKDVLLELYGDQIIKDIMFVCK